MRFLGPGDLRRALPMADAITAMEAAFGDDRETPLRVRLGVSLFMPGRVGPTTGIKVVSTVPGQPMGIVAVFDEMGRTLGLVDGPTLTSIRTGAASGLATRLLARPEAHVLAMLGAGAMAADQVAGVRTVRPIERVMVWSRSPQRAAELAARVEGEPVGTPNEAVALAEIVCCATPSTTPLFEPDVVRPGTHINAVGAFTPEMVEVPPETMHRAYVVVDDHEAAASEAGDLIQSDRPANATLGDLLAGRAPEVGEDVTVFKSVGIASQDVAATERALRRAAERGIGPEVP
jgi:ornithine cyclodeaminase/alanine dehydrogenase-like protein (mu-crystallin family)